MNGYFNVLLFKKLTQKQKLTRILGKIVCTRVNLLITLIYNALRII